MENFKTKVFKSCNMDLRKVTRRRQVFILYV